MYVCDHFRFLPFSKQTYALQPTVNSEAPYEKLVNIIVSYSSSIASVWVIPVLATCADLVTYLHIILAILLYTCRLAYGNQHFRDADSTKNIAKVVWMHY